MIDNVVMLSYKCIECKFTLNINTIDLLDILNDFSYKNVNKHNDSVKLSPSFWSATLDTSGLTNFSCNCGTNWWSGSNAIIWSTMLFVTSFYKLNWFPWYKSFIVQMLFNPYNEIVFLLKIEFLSGGLCSVFLFVLFLLAIVLSALLQLLFTPLVSSNFSN